MHEVDVLVHRAAALKVVISASISFFIMLVDYALLVRDEPKCVWSQLRTSWNAWVYLLARYIGLVGQIFNVYFAVRMYLGIYTSPTGCYVWFTYQALIVQALLFCVEFLLGKRIFDLFLQNRAVLAILILFLCAQFASMGISARFSIHSNKYTPSCWVVKTSPANAFFSATTMTTNTLIFFLTFWRFFQLPKKFTRGVGRVVFRDSTISLAVISVIMLFLTLCSLEVIKPSMGGNIVFSWLVCTLWISVGRIIINQAKVSPGEGELNSMWTESVQLTSQIEMGEVSTSDTHCSSSDGPTESTLQGSSTPTSTSGKTVCSCSAPSASTASTDS